MTDAPLAVPKTIHVDRLGLLIDGVRFGYYLADEPVTVEVQPRGIDRVTITLIADRVTVDAADTEHNGTGPSIETGPRLLPARDAAEKPTWHKSYRLLDGEGDPFSGQSCNCTKDVDHVR
jgi:hypothetical protein